MEVYRHIGGAAGSGLGNLLLESLARDFAKKGTVEVAYHPDYSTTTLEHTVAPYNAIGAISAQSNYSGNYLQGVVINLRNSALRRVHDASSLEAPRGTYGSFDQGHPKLVPFATANRVAAEAMANINMLLMTKQSAWGVPMRDIHSVPTLIAHMVPFQNIRHTIPSLTTATSRPLLKLFEVSSCLASGHRDLSRSNATAIPRGEFFSRAAVVSPAGVSSQEFHHFAMDRMMLKQSYPVDGEGSVRYLDNMAGFEAVTLPRLHQLGALAYRESNVKSETMPFLSKGVFGSSFSNCGAPIECALGPEEWTGSSSSMLVNHQMVTGLFEEAEEAFDRLYARRMFSRVFWWGRHGDDLELEYSQLRNELSDLRQEYSYGFGQDLIWCGEYHLGG